MRSENLNMTEGRPLSLLVRFALPLMLGNLFQQLYILSDTAIVGRGVGMDALAALGTVDWLNWMLLGFAQGLTQGFCVRISQKYGEGDFPGLRRIAGQSARLTLWMSALGTALFQLGIPLFLTFLRVPRDLMPMSLLYSRIVMGGFPAVAFYNYASSVLRAAGDSKTPLRAMVTAAVTNIVLDLLTVFVLHWGIAGAAAATVFSQALSFAICAFKIRRSPILRFGRSDLRRERRLGNDLLRLGLPIAGKNVIIALGGLVLQFVVNGYGMSFIAGYTATNKLYGLMEIAALSYGYAVTTYVGQNYGAGRHDRIKSGMRTALRLALATSAVIGTGMVVFGRAATGLFLVADSPALAAAAEKTAYVYLVVMSVSLPALYLLYAYQAALQGIGRTSISIVSGGLELFMRVSIAVVTGMLLWESGVFLAEVAAWFVAAGYLAWQYYRSLRIFSVKEEH